MKRVVAETPAVVGIPPVRGLRSVAVQLELQTVAVQVEHVRVTVTVDIMPWPIYATTQCEGLRRSPRLNIICDLKSPRPRHQVSSFFMKCPPKTGRSA